MTQERQTDATDGTTDTTGDAAVSSGGQTVEEVEAFWRNRQSGADRAHNAETASLRAQIAEMQKPPEQAPVGETPEQAQVRELRAQLAAEQAARQAVTLQSQFPNVGSALGDAITALPPEKIAALEAMVGEAPVAPRIDPNAAARGNGSIQSPSQTPMNQKTKDELLADLQRMAPAYQEAAKEGLL